MHSSGLSTQSLRQLLLVLCACCACTARSAVVEDLYTATVERPTDVSDQRAAAQSAAMAEVLVRVTGNRNAPLAPELAALTENPGRFVASFGFTITGDAQVRFLPGEIERELTAAGWPLWGAERPLSIFWIAVTDQFGDQAVLNAGEPLPDALYSDHMREILDGLRTDIETVAEQRGLPWVLPGFVTMEEMLLRFDEVWSYSFDSLNDTSSAVQADAVVIVRVRESVIGTDVEWLVRSDSFSGSYPGAGIADGINWLADAFAQEYGSIGGPRTLTLRVSGVSDFDSYARVLAYLESVTMLSDVYVESYRAGELLLRTVSRGDAPVLARTLNLDNVLRERDRIPGPFGPGPPGPGPAQTGSGTTLDLVVVPERSTFDGLDSGF